MDHWGDPWADVDAHDASPATSKPEVTTPPPIASQPVIWNGFMDDAQWGKEEEDHGGRAGGAGPGTPRETRGGGLGGTAVWDAPPQDAYDGTGLREEQGTLLESNEWSRFDEETEEPRDKVVSEPPDSPDSPDSPTAIPAGADAPKAIHSSHPLTTDDHPSIRPSTSPSDASHFGPVAESPCTSFEEERAVEKALEGGRAAAEENALGVVREDETGPGPSPAGSEGVDDDVFGDFEEDAEPAVHGADLSLPRASDAEEPTPDPQIPPTTPHHRTSYQHLLSQLFPVPNPINELREAPDDPVNSTSSRKAWYRLTRKQTLREFDSGTVDDNYIRVTWKTSHIRSEVNKVVARWANEDRVAGRGPGARASFYWDTTAPTDQVPFRARRTSLVSVSNAARPSVPPVSADAPAAFNWSTPSTAPDPSTEAAATSHARSLSSYKVPPQHSAVVKLQRQESRVDTTSSQHHSSSHKRTATATDLLAEAAPIPAWPLAPIALPMEPPASTDVVVDVWASPSALDTIPAPPKPNSATTTAAAPAEADDDDDDWGEMVESPALPTASIPIADPPRPPPRNSTLPPPPRTTTLPPRHPRRRNRKARAHRSKHTPPRRPRDTRPRSCA